MTDDELRATIERPAQLVGCEFDAGLVDLLVEEHPQPTWRVAALATCLTGTLEQTQRTPSQRSTSMMEVKFDTVH
jgi:hypothetical protein